MPASDIRTTLAFLLASALGQTQAHWASLIEIEVLNTSNTDGNWHAKASGTKREIAMITQAARLFATQYSGAHV